MGLNTFAGGSWEGFFDEDPFESGGSKFDSARDIDEEVSNRRYLQGIGNIDDFWIHYNSSIRNSNEGYKLPTQEYPYNSDDEQKNKRRLEMEGVSIETSPISYLKSIIDELKSKLYILDCKYIDKEIEGKEYQHESAIIKKMIIDAQKMYNFKDACSCYQIAGFELIGAVFKDLVDAKPTFRARLSELRSVLEYYYKRDFQLESYSRLSTTEKERINEYITRKNFL
jgi:hypothetical protein